MMNKQLFISVITALNMQYDKSAERASVLGDIYGADIDPVDTSLLEDSIFNLLKSVMKDDHINHVLYFCYDQNFGRKAGVKNEIRTIDDLWVELNMM